MSGSESIRAFMGLAARWWRALVLCAVFAAGIAFAVSMRQASVYEARTTLIVGRSLKENTLDPREVQANEVRVRTFADLVTREPVLEGVVDDLGLSVPWQALRKRVRANPIENTQLFEIIAEAGSPDDAKAIADETASQLRGLSSPSVLSVIEPAQARSSPVRPRIVMNTLVAGIVGLLVGLATIFIWERLAGTLNSGGDVTGRLGLTFLGAVRRVKRGQANPSKAQVRPQSTMDDYRVIRSNIEFTSRTHPVKSIMVTTPSIGRGKTTTAVNLGMAMAQAGLKTILVDADMRQPSLHDIFEVPQQPGLADLLKEADPETFGHLVPTNVDNLLVLPAGTVPPDPADRLDSPRVEQILGALETAFDVIIFDSPPALDFADAVVLAKRVDGVVLVLEAGRTRLDDARRSTLVLERAGATLLGGVLNSVPRRMSYDGYVVPV